MLIESSEPLVPVPFPLPGATWPSTRTPESRCLSALVARGRLHFALHEDTTMRPVKTTLPDRVESTASHAASSLDPASQLHLCQSRGWYPPPSGWPWRTATFSWTPRWSCRASARGSRTPAPRRPPTAEDRETVTDLHPCREILRECMFMMKSPFFLDSPRLRRDPWPRMPWSLAPSASSSARCTTLPCASTRLGVQERGGKQKRRMRPKHSWYVCILYKPWETLSTRKVEMVDVVITYCHILQNNAYSS